MTDPAGGHGWRGGRQLGLGPLAERVAPVEARPLCVLLLPCALEEVADRDRVEALLALHPDAELWYGGEGAGELQELAAGRAALRFPPRWDNRVLWERMERLAIETRRLGSERLT